MKFVTISRFARPLSRPSRMTVAMAGQSQEFHSSLDNPSMVKSESMSSLRDPEVDPSNLGRFAHPSRMTVAKAGQSQEFHSSLDNPSMVKSESMSSLRDPEVGPHNWGGFARPLSRSSGMATAGQSQEFHSSRDNPSMVNSESKSSLRDPEVDPRNWGYRVVLPSNRVYTTSSVHSFSIREDYDDYTLHMVPSESSHCDLGTFGMALSPTSEVETFLQFDDAGLVRPVWETVGASSNESAPSSEEWSMDYRTEPSTHETVDAFVPPAVDESAGKETR